MRSPRPGGWRPGSCGAWDGACELSSAGRGGGSQHPTCLPETEKESVRWEAVARALQGCVQQTGRAESTQRASSGQGAEARASQLVPQESTSPIRPPISYWQGLQGQDVHTRAQPAASSPPETVHCPGCSAALRRPVPCLSSCPRLRKPGSPLPGRARGPAPFYSPNRKSPASFWPDPRGTDFISAKTNGQEVSLPKWADGPMRSPGIKPSAGLGPESQQEGPRQGRTEPRARGPSAAWPRARHLPCPQGPRIRLSNMLADLQEQEVPEPGARAPP